MATHSEDAIARDCNQFEVPLTTDESRARAKAIRGLAKLKSGEFETARSYLIEAATLDPAIDFRRMPDFWNLPGLAHQTVVDALYDADLRMPALRLVADLRTRFRPRLVGMRED